MDIYLNILVQKRLFQQYTPGVVITSIKGLAAVLIHMRKSDLRFEGREGDLFILPLVTGTIVLISAPATYLF